MSEIKVVQYEHFGRTTNAIEHLMYKNRHHCLCWQGCKSFKPGSEDNCIISQKLYYLCKEFGLITPVYECPAYEPKPPE